MYKPNGNVVTTVLYSTFDIAQF